MNKTILKNYAKLIAQVGVNVQKGQDVTISASVDDAYFVKYVVEECYKCGARTVVVDWGCTEITKLNYNYQALEDLCEIPDYVKARLDYRAEKLPARINILSSDPDGLKGVDSEKMHKVQVATSPIYAEHRRKIDNLHQWTIVAIPGEKWAMKMYPELSKSQAIKAQWDAILKTTRVYGDPIKNWEEHNKNLSVKTSKLNELNIKTLTYKASNGTDFSIDINQNMSFLAGGEHTYQGVFYNPNMPTEECFTSPIKTSCNGIVMASKPLSVRGVLVDNFGFKFVDGKAVEVICDNSEYKDVLEKLISTDEGACMLGEVALVPFDSPVNQIGKLFYNTLFDENACCHLALGRAFTECITDYQHKSEEEIKAIDLNESMIHVDFMIGTNDLSIKALTYSGEEVEIFKDGVWAI